MNEPFSYCRDCSQSIIGHCWRHTMAIGHLPAGPRAGDADEIGRMREELEALRAAMFHRLGVAIGAPVFVSGRVDEGPLVVMTEAERRALVERAVRAAFDNLGDGMGHEPKAFIDRITDRVLKEHEAANE